MSRRNTSLLFYILCIGKKLNGNRFLQNVIEAHKFKFIEENITTIYKIYKINIFSSIKKNNVFNINV